MEREPLKDLLECLQAEDGEVIKLNQQLFPELRKTDYHSRYNTIKVENTSDS